VTVDLGGQRATILSIHPPPPIGGSATALRNSMLQAAADWAGRVWGAKVLIGDLNITAWAPSFDVLVKSFCVISDMGWTKRVQ
jgi:hypothetical protein